MQITGVSYRRLFNLGNYENEQIGAECSVEPGEPAHEALDVLRMWVEREGGRAQAERRATAELEQIRQRIATGEDEIRRALHLLFGDKSPFGTSPEGDEDIPF